MDSTAWTIVIVVAAVVLLALAVFWWMSMRRKNEEKRLQSTFGREYDETYARTGDQKQARQELKARADRVDSYQLRPLENDQRRRFIMEWETMQASFVDDPANAVTKADVLLADVMKARGYETDSGDQAARIEDVSVGHGDEAAAFREAAEISRLNRDGRATTEDLRRAIKDYAVVFDSLLNERQRA